jgi:hypothetical protein
MTSYPWRTTTLRRSTAEASPEPTNGLNTPTVGLSTSTRFSTRTSTAAGHSYRRTRRHTWTAAAPTQDSYTTPTQPYTSSQIVVGDGWLLDDSDRLPALRAALIAHKRLAMPHPSQPPERWARTLVGRAEAWPANVGQHALSLLSHGDVSVSLRHLGRPLGWMLARAAPFRPPGARV